MPEAFAEKKIWKDALDAIRVSISSATFSTWFSQTFIASAKKASKGRNIIEIGCPSSFVADTIERRYFGLIQDSLNSITGEKNDLEFIVKQNPATPKEDTSPLFSQQPIKEDTPASFLKKARVREGFTFNNFAVSATNQMAWAAADAVSKSLGKAYNPLFLWGGVGVGKTHLMLAVGHAVLEKRNDAKVLYCMGEEFTTEIIEAIRNKNTASFKRRYRSLDLLLLDDVQFLAGKNAVQEEFFHTFNTLQREGGQIVLTSDRPPQEIEKLEERLRNRCEAGLIIDIARPDFELRTAIALIKAQERGINLSMEAAQSLAANIETARQIEGALTRLLSITNAVPGEVSEEGIRRILGKPNGEASSVSRHVRPQDLVNTVADYFSLGKRKLLGPTRTRPVAVPRQVLMYLLRTELGLPLQEVGRIAGGRDHTTVMHAVEKISTSLSTDENLRRDVLGIKNSLF